MKGDFVRIIVAAGGESHDTKLVASKGGRTVQVKYGAKWLDAEEYTAPSSVNPKGRPTGNKVRVRVDSLVSVEERRGEDLSAPQFRIKRVATPPIDQPSLDLDRDTVAVTLG